MRWAPVPVQEARRMRNLALLRKISPALLGISVTSPPVLAACPLDKRSFLEPQFTSSPLRRFLYSQSSWLLLGSAHNIIWECCSKQQPVAQMAPTSFKLPQPHRGCFGRCFPCPWEQDKESAGCSIPVFLIFLLFFPY